MSSNNTYTQTIPYFYIIRHIDSGKMYAGSKWATGCNPNTFMQPDGYTTSSPTINSIIESQRLSAFEILRIDTNLDGISAYDYETAFLQTLDCASSPEWFNGHNNSGMAWGLPEFMKKSKETCLLKYGVEFSIQSPEIKEKSRQTLLEIYGVDNVSKAPEIKQKKMDTVLKNYGVEYPIQSCIIKNQITQTVLEIYGVDNISKAPEIKQKKMDKAAEKYGAGIINVFQAEEVKEQIKQTNKKRYGYENIQQCPEIKEQIKQTNIERYGYGCTLQSPEIREKGRKSYLKEHGYDHQSKKPFLSIIETKKSYAKNILSKCYPEFKRFY